MSLNSIAAGATKNFAHLIGRGNTKATKKAEDDDDKKKDDKKDDAAADDKKEPPADDKEDGKKGKGKKADKEECDDDDDKNMSAAKDDEDDEDDSEGDGEDEEGDDDKKERAELNGPASSASSARDRERARCCAIFASEHASGRPDVAANMAFKTKMTAKEAIAVMASLGPVKNDRARLDNKMSTVKNPDVGAGDTAASNGDPAAQLAASIIAAGNKARGNK